MFLSINRNPSFVVKYPQSHFHRNLPISKPFLTNSCLWRMQVLCGNTSRYSVFRCSAICSIDVERFSSPSPYILHRVSDIKPIHYHQFRNRRKHCLNSATTFAFVSARQLHGGNYSIENWFIYGCGE